MIFRKNSNEEDNKQPPAPVEADAEQTDVKHKRANVLGWGLLAIALILCVFVISQILSQGYISIGGYSLFRVATGSMEPELPIGTILISEETDISRIQKGDIINYHSKLNGMIGVVITHRVIGIHQDASGKIYLETKGDANQYADGSYVDEENLIGKVVFATAKGSIFAYLIQFLTSEVGFLICIVLPCLAIGLLILRDTVGSMKKEIDTLKKELDEQDLPQKADLEQQMGQEAYGQLCEQLRKELLEELNQSAEKVHTENQPDSQQQQ
ncbi:MAG: signal peptidase I [Ruminococcaceae bacterium]|nr:signal peptidase I [Oscillospiraceae bacterium]